jgi:hypothetical protein
MHTIDLHQLRAVSKSQRFVLRASFGAALLVGLGALSPSFAQDAPATPAPVPGAGTAAAQAKISGSGATTGAGSDPISATTLMKATGTSGTSSGMISSTKKGKKKDPNKTGSIEPWPGRRVLLMLPLQIGAGFNADRAFGQAILSRAEAQLQDELESTGKFSVIRAHRFSPLLQRALQEKRVSADEAENVIEGLPPGAAMDAVDDPITVQGATTFLQRFTFDQLPMVAQFSLEEVRSSSVQGRPGVQAQVSGRLYEQGNPVALKSPVLTSEVFTKGRNNIDRYLDATRQAFGAIAGTFVAPLEDVVLPTTPITGAAAAMQAPVAAPATPADTSMGAVNTTPEPAPVVSQPEAPQPAAPAADPSPAVAPGTEPAAK